MKAVAYLRISQENENIENQLMKIKEYCKQKGFELVGVFKDIAVSWTKATEKREGFKSMLKFCEDNNVKVIVFYDISRMSRNVLDGLKTLKELTEKAIRQSLWRRNFSIT